MLYAAEGAVLGCCPHPRGLQKASATYRDNPPPQPRPVEAPFGSSHEESSWCSWRPFKGRARADGGWVCLACSTGKKEQAPARAIFVQGSLWVWHPCDEKRTHTKR